MKALSFYSFFLFLFLLSNIYCTPTGLTDAEKKTGIDKLQKLWYTNFIR